MFDPILPVQTADDREAAVAWIVPEDVATALPLQGWMRNPSGGKVHHGWTRDGKSIGTVNADDLLNVEGNLA